VPVTASQAIKDMELFLEESPEQYLESLGVAGKRILSIEILPTAVSRAFSPGWLKKRFGF